MATKKSQQGSNSKRIIIIVLIVLLLGGNGYLGYTYYKHEQKIQTQQTQITNLEEKKAELNADIDSMEDVIVKWQDSTDIKNKKLAQLRKDLKEKKKELEKKQGTINWLSVKKRELETLRDSLQDIVNPLKDSLNTLKAENTQLQDTLQETNKKKEELAEANKELEKKMKEEPLKAQNIMPKGLKSSGGDVTDNPNQVEIFRVCYDVPETQLEPPGEKKIHIQVTKPNGEIMTVKDESGSFELSESGESVEYTVTSSFQYKQERQEGVCIEWKVEDLEEGTYTTKLYHKGQLIGEKENELDSKFLGIF